MEFQWSFQAYDLKTFVNKYSSNLPIIVKVREGFHGIEKDDEYSYPLDDEYRLTHLKRQSRIITKDGIGRHISIPVDHPIKFRKMDFDGKLSEAKPLCDLMATLYKDDEITVEDDCEIDFWIGVDKRISQNLGRLTFIAEYRERFLVGNTIVEGELQEEPIVIPAYVGIKVAIATTLANGSPEQFDDVRREFAIKSQDFQNDQAHGNKEIMLFEGKISDFNDYDYVKPSNFLRPKSETPPNDYTPEPAKSKVPPVPSRRQITTVQRRHPERHDIMLRKHPVPEKSSDSYICMEQAGILKARQETKETTSYSGDDMDEEGYTKIKDPSLRPMRRSKTVPSRSSTLPQTVPVGCQAGDIAKTAVAELTVDQVGQLLDEIKLTKYKEKFNEDAVDGKLLCDLTSEDLIADYNFRRIEAKKLVKRVEEGWKPKL